MKERVEAAETEAPKLTGQSDNELTGANIVFFDGVCGLCNGFVQFVIRNDKRELFRFASLQSEFAQRELSRYHEDPSLLKSMYVMPDFKTSNERLLSKSTGVLFVAKRLAAPLPQLAIICGFIPTFLRDVVYKFVAKIRYKLFGRFETCMLPTEENKKRFIDF